MLGINLIAGAKTHILYQGVTSVVPQKPLKKGGFSP